MESPAQQILIEELVVEFPEIRQIEDRHLRLRRLLRWLGFGEESSQPG